MIRTEILEILVEFAKVEIDVKHINDTTDLYEDLKIKSAQMVDIILEIEDLYNIEVEPDDIDRMFTVGEMFEILKNYID